MSTYGRSFPVGMVALLLIALATAACGSPDASSEATASPTSTVAITTTSASTATTTATTSPEGRVAVTLADGGVLDCPSEMLESSISDFPADIRGEASPELALAAVFDPPQGTSAVFSETSDSVIFEFTSGDGYRVAHYGAHRVPSGGWVINTTESCFEEP